MKDAVRDAFVPFTAKFEGIVPWLYQDVKGLVSIGIGNLVDPIALAMDLPFVRVSDGRPATREQIADEWQRVKTQPPDAQGRTAAQLGHLYTKQVTTLRLMDDGIRKLVAGKLAQNEACLLTGFPDFKDWPADAQLATLSMAWAVGPAFWEPRAGRNYWPRLTAALRDQDFRMAAIECFMHEEATISGLRPRNTANRILYTNAAIVKAMFDPDHLYYPTDLEAGPQTDRPPTIRDFVIVHPRVPLRGDPENDDDPDPEAA